MTDNEPDFDPYKEQREALQELRKALLEYLREHFEPVVAAIARCLNKIKWTKS